MLALLARFGPALLPVLIGAISAFAAGWFAHGLKFDWIDRPGIIREATATADSACAIRTMDAANRAEQAARARQQAIDAEALRIYREALDASQRAALATEARMAQEIAAYETELVAEGRSCPVTQRDLDWVRGLGSPSTDSSR